jgi:hypothetical protein
LTTYAAAQTQPAPEGWLPQEQSREQLPAKSFGTWCRVKEDEESEEYVSMLLGAGDPRRCQIFHAAGNLNEVYHTVLNCNGEWVRYTLISDDDQLYIGL